jgi:hypothetical protein
MKSAARIHRMHLDLFCDAHDPDLLSKSRVNDSQIGSSTYAESAFMEGILVATAARAQETIVTAVGLSGNGGKAVGNRTRVRSVNRHA